MDLYQLKTFFILAKIGSYTEAADFIGVTQSAVSHAIKKLETSTNNRLISKKGKAFSLTPAGQTLFSACETIFYELEKTEDALKQYRKDAIWHICLGAPVEFGSTILIRHMKNFMQQYPHIQVDFLFSHHLRQPFLRDTVDFMIDCKDHRLPDTEKFFLFREQYVAIGSPDYIAHHGVKTEQDLKRVNILSLDKEATWWKNFQVALPGNASDLFKRITRINHVRGLINGAINGLGIGFVPKYTVIRELADNVLADPFPDIRPAADHFNIFIKTKKLALAKNKTLIDHLIRIKPTEFGAMASAPAPCPPGGAP